MGVGAVLVRRTRSLVVGAFLRVAAFSTQVVGKLARAQDANIAAARRTALSARFACWALGGVVNVVEGAVRRRDRIDDDVDASSIVAHGAATKTVAAGYRRPAAEVNALLTQVGARILFCPRLAVPQ